MNWNIEYVPMKVQRPSQRPSNNTIVEVRCPQCNSKEYRYYTNICECFRCQFTWKLETK